ncbi:MAG: TonB family protein [Cyclobacteriaceae bacterium]|nr:TonB family protein [Cyclobacteriaceae bacterium]
MTNREHDILRYLRGEMTAAEQHALEKAALSDPLLAEALEGLAQLPVAELQSDLNELSTELENETEHIWQAPAAKRMAASMSEVRAAAGPAPVAKSGAPARGNQRVWWLRVAAILLVGIAGYWLWPLFTANPQSDLVLQKETAPEVLPATDSLVAATRQAAAPPTETIPEKDQRKPIAPMARSKEKPAAEQKPEEQPTLELTPEKQLAEAHEVPSVLKAEDVIVDEALKKEAKDKTASAATTSKTIRGKVITEEDQIPLPGVNIVVKGKPAGVVTDINGNYQLTVPESTVPITLSYSFIGLQTQEVVIKDATEVNVALKTDVAQLSEVVITGYSPSGVDPNHEPVLKLAQPAGGLRAYDRYLKNSLHYPQQALDNNVRGKVTVQFTVNTDGSLNEFNVLKGLGYGCDEEVIRLVKEGPRWSPTTQDGAPVASEVRVRVKFAPPGK